MPYVAPRIMWPSTVKYLVFTFHFPAGRHITERPKGSHELPVKDERTYRVSFSKIRESLPQFKPVWNVQKGIMELYQAYKDFNLTLDDFEAPKYFRVRWIRYLMEQNKLDRNLKWTNL